MAGEVVSDTGGTCLSSQAKTLTRIKRNVLRGRCMFRISCVQPRGKGKTATVGPHCVLWLPLENKWQGGICPHLLRLPLGAKQLLLWGHSSRSITVLILHKS